MDSLKYLARIGLDANEMPKPTYETLCRLQWAHVCSVPYENIDIIRGIPLRLDPDALYEKIVTRHRGGYCFELNCLYERLLVALGFSTVSYFARFWRGEAGLPLRRHRVIGVRLDGKTYIADVGIGSVAPRMPLLLEEGLEQTCFGECYRFTRDPSLGWVLWELHHGEWQRYFSFTEERMEENDFYAISYYCEHHPDSKFNKAYMVAMKTEEGRVAVDGNTFKVFCGAELASIEEGMSEARLREVLERYFGLTDVI